MQNERLYFYGLLQHFIVPGSMAVSFVVCEEVKESILFVDQGKQKAQIKRWMLRKEKEGRKCCKKNG